MAQESGALTLCVSNTILKNPGQVESNRIGLRICEKIMRQMGGTFEKRQTEDTFTVTLTLPRSRWQSRKEKPLKIFLKLPRRAFNFSGSLL